MPLREALRGLRHVLRRGGATLRETLTIDMLPQPAAHLAGSMLRDVETLAKGADRIASELAKAVLGGVHPASSSLAEIAARGDHGELFAAAAYPALRDVLLRLGAKDAFVSEAAARSAFAAAHAQMLARDTAHAAIEETPGTDDKAAAEARMAAALTLAMIEARAIRGLPGGRETRVTASALEPVALFSVMLWLQSGAGEEENEAALSAATDLAVALAGDVETAARAGDAARIAALYLEFASHV
jgi:hypothetical protein